MKRNLIGYVMGVALEFTMTGAKSINQKIWRSCLKVIKVILKFKL